MLGKDTERPAGALLKSACLEMGHAVKYKLSKHSDGKAHVRQSL